MHLETKKGMLNRRKMPFEEERARFAWCCSYLDDLFPCFDSWQGEVQLLIESAGSPQGRIYGFYPVRSSDHYDSGFVVQAVHEG